MRFSRLIWVVLIGLFVFPITTQAQKGLLEKANKQYELHNFKEAIVTYQRFLKNNRNNIEAKGKLADSFRQLGRYKEALRWHNEIGYASKDFPDFNFQHALTLKEMGQYADARKLFLDYAETNPEVGMHFAKSSTLALEKLNSSSTYTVTNEYLSSDASDYGPAFFKDGIVYSSARIDFSEKSRQRDDLNQLFIARQDFNGNLGSPQLFHERFKGFNEGPISYSPDGRWVAITKNNFIDGVRQIPSAGLNLNLFVAEVLENGEWQKEKFFPYNGSNFSTGYASFSPDGNYLYFASDRPDGFGGFDLFVSQRIGDSWSTPENLGPNVNTAGNEITPFFDGQDLFFASDWHPGMGGYDVFRASRNGNYWDRIYNLDTQINSSRDDYGFIFNPNGNIGYLVSNRDGGKGKEDIYKVTKGYGGYAGGNPSNTGGTYPNNTGGTYPNNTGGTYPNNTGGTYPNNTGGTYPNNTGGTYPNNTGGGYPGTYPTTARTLEIVVLDEFSMRPIQNAEIDFTLCGQGRYYTNASGRYTLNIPAGLNCEILIRQQGYITGLLRVSGNSLNGVQSQQILLRSGNATVPNQPPVVTVPTTRPPVVVNPPTNTTPIYTNNLIMGRIYENGSNTGVSNVDIKAVNQTTGSILETYTAVTGEYNLTLQPNTTYIITYSKPGYQAVKRTVTVGSVAEPQLLGAYPIQFLAGGSGVIVDNTSTSPPVVETSKGGGTSVGSGLAGYSIQVGAFASSEKANFEKYRSLGTYGNVYNRYEGNRTKVRVGVFQTRAEAQAVVSKIKSAGYRDAFITSELQEGLGDGILLDGSNTGVAVTTSSPSVPSTSTGGIYKVRLASYRNPKFFKASKVEGLGVLERRTKGPWTIMVLSGYNSASEAIFAKNNAIKAGFRQAHVVTDTGGELKKVKF